LTGKRPDLVAIAAGIMAIIDGAIEGPGPWAAQ